MGPPGSTAELHTRCQPQQKSEGSSRDPEPQPGTKGGQRRQRKVKGEVRSSRRRKDRERELREKRKGEQKEDTGQRGGKGTVRGLESGHGGSLGASRFFTNEGSKKKKNGGSKGRPTPCWGKGPGKSSILSPLQQGSTRNGGPSVQRRGVSSVPTLCSDHTLRSPHSHEV